MTYHGMQAVGWQIFVSSSGLANTQETFNLLEVTLQFSRFTELKASHIITAYSPGLQKDSTTGKPM